MFISSTLLKILYPSTLNLDRPGVVHVNSQALTKILEGSKRAKSHYFLKVRKIKYFVTDLHFFC